MSSRPGWAAMLLGLCGCGDVPEPSWLLNETPRVLAVRTEVVEPGPLSYDLLPIPADRVRSQPLPGDTIDVSAWIVAGEREIATDEADPAWFICPRSGGCLSTLGPARTGEPCEGPVATETACRLPDGARPSFITPPLDPQTPLEEQTRFRIAMVGHVDGQMTTEECIERVSDPTATDWADCIVAYRSVRLGPLLRLVAHASDVGIELPDLPELSELPRDQPVSPHFNPEVIPFTLFPYYGGERGDSSRSITAALDEVVTLQPGAVYLSGGFRDPKDAQESLVLGDTELSFDSSVVTRSMFSTTPGVLEFTDTPGWQIWTPEEGGSFEIRLVIHDQIGGTAWTTLRFEVAAP